MKEVKEIIKLALPLLMAFLAQKGMQIIDTIMMGWLGPYALAAGALGISVFMTSLVFCMGVFSAVGICLVRARGTQQPHEIMVVLQGGLLLVVVLSLPFMLMNWFVPLLFSVFGQNVRVVQGATLLLHGLVWGFPGYLFFAIFREFLSVFSLARAVMWVAFCSIPLTFIANYALIYGKWGLPALGIAGIGYASAAVMWFMAFCLFIYCRRHTTLKQYMIGLSRLSIDYSKIKDMLVVGSPSGFLLIADMGMFLLAAIMIGYMSVDALAAHQIGMQCITVAFGVPLSLSIATALRVGHGIGADRYLQIKESIYAGLVIGLVASGAIGLVFLLLPDWLIALFLTNANSHYQAVHQLATSLLLIAAFFQCIDALQAIVNGALRGFKDTLLPMLVGIGCYGLLGMGGAYYFGFYRQLGAIGVWYGLTLGILSLGIILSVRLLWQLMRLSKEF